MLDKQIELELVRQYRPLLYMYLIKNKHSGYKFVVVGGASLEFLINNAAIVDTSDVDIHVWLDAEPNPAQDREDYLMKSLAGRIQSFFNDHEFLQANKGIHNYFEARIPQVPYYQSRIIPGTVHHHPTHRIRIFGVDIADIRYKYEHANQYFILHAVPTLTVSAYFYSQVEIFTQKHNQGMLLHKYLYASSLQELARIIIDNYNFVKSHHSPHKYQWKEISNFLDNIARSMVYNMVDSQKESSLPVDTRDRLRTRYYKTCRRLAIVLLFFDFKDSGKKILFAFKKDWSACTALNKDKILGFGQTQNVHYLTQDVDYCQKKIVFNSDVGISQQTHTLSNTLLRTTHAPFRDADFRTSFPDIWRWTVKSTPITNECKTFYLKSLLGLPHRFDPEIQQYIQRLQTLLFKNNYSTPLEVYKTSRVIVFSKDVDSLTLRKNSSVLQYFFNSTTITPHLPNLLHFASYEVGACAYVIRLPPHFPCMYVGSDRRSAYAYELEIILPFGTEFRITNIRTESYIKKQNKFYKLRTYEVDAVLPPPHVCAADGTIHWGNFAKYIRQSSHKDCHLTSMPTPSVSTTEQIPCPDTTATLYAVAAPEVVHQLQTNAFDGKQLAIMAKQLWLLFRMAAAHIWKTWIVPPGNYLLQAIKASSYALFLACVRAFVSTSRWLADSLQKAYLKE